MAVVHLVHWCNINGSHSFTPKRSLYLRAVVRAIGALVVWSHGAVPPGVRAGPMGSGS